MNITRVRWTAIGSWNCWKRWWFCKLCRIKYGWPTTRNWLRDRTIARWVSSSGDPDDFPSNGIHRGVTSLAASTDGEYQVVIINFYP